MWHADTAISGADGGRNLQVLQSGEGPLWANVHAAVSAFLSPVSSFLQPCEKLFAATQYITKSTTVTLYLEVVIAFVLAAEVETCVWTCGPRQLG